ncbi:MAG TPA: flagellar basal body-associated FliL family protein [Caulobacterales bacterium]|jgi:flagellar FliL protein|nr:flagellar basal body-associated FliL family protein [Caulobacterales bacterium]
MRAPAHAKDWRNMAAKEKKPKPPKPKKEKKGKKGEAAQAEAEGGEEKPATEGEAGEGGEGEAPKKKLAGKTLVLFILLPLLLIIGGGGTASYFLFFNKTPAQIAEAKKQAELKEKRAKHAGKEGEAGPISEGDDGVYYYTLPEMLVNITSGDGRPVYLKLKLTLEAPNEDTAYAIEPQLPRVMDEYQAFLRELRVDDLAGSAGTYRLRLELLRRANLAIAPAQLNAVLIEEMLVQ